ININLLYTLIFALSAMLAALAGIMMGPLLSVEPGAGDPILILALVVVVIGGIGSVRGALVGALMVGIFDTLSRVLIPLVVHTNATSALVGMAVYVLMAVVLLFSRTGRLPRIGAKMTLRRGALLLLLLAVAIVLPPYCG